MYISGNAYNLEKRIHQMPISGADFDSFAAEASSYNLVLPFSSQYRITKEFNKKYFSSLRTTYSGTLFFYSDPAYSGTPVFDFSDLGNSMYLNLI